MSDPIYYYRFGLYGSTASGKTTLLTALSLRDTPSPEGYTAIWRRDLHKGKPAAEAAEPIFEQAREALQNGKAVDPTRVADKQLMYFFEFADPERGHFIAEITDFSGELFGNLSQSELRDALQQHLREMDGIVILAPMLRDAGDSSEKAAYVSEIRSLREAFAELYDEKRLDKQGMGSNPVVLLMTKWDHQSDLTGSPDAESAKLTEFLENTEEPPPQVVFYQGLKNKVPQEDLGVYPVSALGPSQLITDEQGREVEVPKTTYPLRSFGIEAPFIWLVRRTDHLALQEFNERHQQLTAGLKTFFPPWPRPVGRHLAQGKALFHRFREDSEPAQKLQTELGRARKAWLARTATLGVLFILGVVLVDMAWMASQRYPLRAESTAPDATAEDVQAYRTWLGDYADSRVPRFAHLVFPPGAAREERNGLLAEAEEACWQRTQQAEALSDQANQARVCLERFPQGEHQQQLQQIQDEWASVRRQQVDKQAWAQVEAASTLSEKARYAEAYLDKTQNFGTHTKEASAIIARYQSRQDWQSFRAAYDRHMERGRLAEAARLLDGRAESSDKLQNLKSNFKTRAPKRMDEQIRSYIADQRWEDGQQALARYRQMPAAFRTPAMQTELDTLQQALREAWDRTLYANIQARPSRSRLNEYLNTAPLQSMETEVQAFLGYLETVRGTLDPTIQITRIDWGANYKNTDIRFAVDDRSRDKRVVAKKKEPLRNVIRIKLYNKRLRDTVELNISLIEDHLFGETEFGRTQRRISLEQLARPFSLTFDDDDKITRVWIHITNLPDTPKLPAWNA